MEITAVINGKKMNLSVLPDEMLIETLRGLGLYSVRCGCDTTNCGLCTVWMDGKPVLSCAVPSFRIEGHEITTLEGVKEEAEAFAACMAAEGADQCGYCSTGFIMGVLALKRLQTNVTKEEIDHVLAGNLCRCTGYMSQLRAIERYLGVKVCDM